MLFRSEAQVNFRFKWQKDKGLEMYFTAQFLESQLQQSA